MASQMKRTSEVEQIGAALKRAAEKAIHGTREERSGRFLPEKERLPPDGRPQENDQKQEEANAQEIHLTEVANHTLIFFEETATIARQRLADSNRPQSVSGVLASSANTITGDRAVQNLARINSNQLRELEYLASEPAIARIVLSAEDGREEVYFIARAGTLPPSEGRAAMASYRSPIGRLAALRVGQDEDVRTPQGSRNYELRERAALRPTLKSEGWDSLDTVIDSFGSRPVTVVSLRELLRAETPDGVDFLESLMAEGRAAENVLQGIRRDVRKKMGLRDQPLLDEIQDGIFRIALDSKLVVLGPPGTGKTTTLIKRLGLKLDSEYLEEHERIIVDQTLAGPSKHGQSWMMFSPTELLKQYVKEAFAREEIPASDERIKTWADYSRNIARNKLGVLRTDTSNGPFVLRPTLDAFQSTTLERQPQWFDDFQAWQTSEFWKELAMFAGRLAANADQNVAKLGKRLSGVIAGDTSPADKFITIASASEELQSLISRSRAFTDEKIRNGLGRLFKDNPDLIGRLMQFVVTLDDDVEEMDDSDAEEDEESRRPTDRTAAIDACIRAVRSQARAAASGRTFVRASRSGRLIEFLGGKVLPPDELKIVGLDLHVQMAAQRLTSPLARYVSGAPRRYRRFRRERQSAGRWYRPEGFAATDIAPIETDAVLLAMLGNARDLLRDIRISNNVDQGPYAILRTVQELFRTQIVVDEATDFSPVQLACMAALCDPAANSFFACGDFNQRITAWGTRSKDELSWAVPKIGVQEIRISYRHSVQLNELAHHLALLSDPIAVKTALPEDVINNGVKPVLAKSLLERSEVAKWLAARISEIERLTGALPSIAVLVNEEEEVEPLAKALDATLAEHSIRAVACLNGQTVGQDNDVRVFDVKHIKGLEFEAVFFIAVDELSERLPNLFDKFLYVGTTRAATFLGWTTRGDSLPKTIQPLESLFQESWLS
jgi:DNA helicase IV